MVGSFGSFCIMRKFRLEANRCAMWVGLPEEKPGRGDGWAWVRDTALSLVMVDLCVRMRFLVHQLRRLWAQAMCMF